MNNREKIILVCILFLAFILRFYKLGQNPPSLTWDETAIGYNAYSILKTGRDEHGRFLPINYFTSFGDYKPPISVYLTIPSVAIFGLNEFSTRFPSAFLGTLTVLITYFLVKKMFNKDSGVTKFISLSNKGQSLKTKRTVLKKESNRLKSVISNLLNLEPRTSSLEPAIASLLLAISPWHILSSRAGFEANIATFFIVLGAYFFIKAIKNKGWLLLLSAFCFLLSIYTFNTPRLFVPIFLFGLSIIYRKKLFQIKKWVLLSTFFGLKF